MGVNSLCERKGEMEKFCVPELYHPFDAQYPLPLPVLAVEVPMNSSFPRAYPSQDHRTRRDALIHHRLNGEGTTGGPGVLAFLSGIEDPISSRWVVVDGKDDGTLVGWWRPIVSWVLTLRSARSL